MLAQLRSMLEPGSPILALCWGYVGPAAVYVGAMLAHLEAMLGLCWPPRRWFWGYVVFMSSPSFPKFAWKSSPQWPARHPFHFATPFLWKSWILPGTGAPPIDAWRLPPVACEVPGNAAEGVDGAARSPLSKARFASVTLPPVTSEFHASHVFAPTSGLRVAQTSEKGSAA